MYSLFTGFVAGGNGGCYYKIKTASFSFFDYNKNYKKGDKNNKIRSLLASPNRDPFKIVILASHSIVGSSVAVAPVRRALGVVRETFVQTVHVRAVATLQLANRFAGCPKMNNSQKVLFKVKVKIIGDTHGQWHTVSGQLGG